MRLITHFRLIYLLGTYSCVRALFVDTWQTLSMASAFAYEQLSEYLSRPWALLCVVEAEWSGGGPGHSCARH
jgi:hypothetical protein